MPKQKNHLLSNSNIRASNQEKEVDTREKILEAATRVFAQKGYSATIEQIAEVMGASKGNIYYYFDSKQTLLFHLLQRAMKLLLEGVGKIEDVPADERLRKLLRNHVINLCENKDLMTVMMDLHRELSPEQWQVIVDLRNNYEDKIREIIREGVDKGFFLPYDENILTYSLLGSINWVYTWYKNDGRLTPDEIADIISEHLLKGMQRGKSMGIEPGLSIDEISVGDSASFSKTISDTEICLFAGLTGDFNPLHVNEEFAKFTPYGGCIAPGGYTTSLIAPVLGTILPGLGTVAVKTSCEFMAPVYPGDTVTASATVTEIEQEENMVQLQLSWVNQNNKLVASGQARVMPPSKELKKAMGQGE